MTKKPYKPNCGPNPRECCPEPDFPSFCPQPQHKPHPCMPPAPSVVEGQSLYEAVNNLTNRVNVCIDTYNHVMANCYETLHNMQRAAEEQGAYYDKCEIWTESGYYADESATYHLTHKANVDRRGEPIRIQLHLAYGNTTNSKIEQELFNASKITYADKIVVAQPKTENGWYGQAIWNGCPIATSEQPTLYTMGFTRSGVMRVYHNDVSVDQMLRDTVENAMGVSGVLIQNSQVCDDSYFENIPDYLTQQARICIGQNLDTREVIILTCGQEDNVSKKGLTSKACAQILLQYGCDIAVELAEGKAAGACDKGQLMFVPNDNEVPTAYAFWYISRKCYYKNDYQREMAELTQNYGECVWQGYLNELAIKDVKLDLDNEINNRVEADNALRDLINTEAEARVEADKQLQANIDTEASARVEADNALRDLINGEAEARLAADKQLQANIDTEANARLEADKALQANIDTEATARVAADNALRELINTEATSRVEADNALQGQINTVAENLDTEINRAKGEEQRIEQKLDEEITRSKDTDDDLQAQITKEIQDRIDGDATLHQEVLTEQGARIAADEVLQTNINNEASERAKQDQALQADIDQEVIDRQEAISNLNTELSGRINAIDARVTTLESEVVQLNELTANLQTQITTTDKNVAEMQNTINQIQQSIGTITTSLTEIQQTMNDIIGGVYDLPYVKANGQTLIGENGMRWAMGEGTSKSITISQTGGDVDDEISVKLNLNGLQVTDNNTKRVRVRNDEVALVDDTQTVSMTNEGFISNDNINVGAIADGEGVYTQYDKDNKTIINNADKVTAKQIDGMQWGDSPTAIKELHLGSGTTDQTEQNLTTVWVKSERFNVDSPSVNFSSNEVYNVGDPISNASAANKRYVDNQITGVNESITQIQGDVTELEGKVEQNTTNITNLNQKVEQNTTNITNITEKVEDLEQGQATIEGDYLPLAGGQMKGSITFDDDTGANLKFNGGWEIKPATEGISIQGGQGFLQLHNQHDTTGIYLSAPVISMQNRRVQKVADPTEAQDAATKNYVDYKIQESQTTIEGEYLPLAGGTMTGDIVLSGNGSVQITNEAKTSALVVADNGANIIGDNAQLSIANNQALLTFGSDDKLTIDDHQFNVHNQIISGVATPQAGNEAANKEYVDNAVATAQPSGNFVKLNEENEATENTIFKNSTLNEDITITGGLVQANDTETGSKAFLDTSGVGIKVQPEGYSAQYKYNGILANTGIQNYTIENGTTNIRIGYNSDIGINTNTELTLDGNQILLESLSTIELNPAAKSINVNGSRIRNLEDPSTSQDAATKAYVDSKIGGGNIEYIATGKNTNDWLDLYRMSLNNGKAIMWLQSNKFHTKLSAFTIVDTSGNLAIYTSNNFRIANENDFPELFRTIPINSVFKFLVYPWVQYNDKTVPLISNNIYAFSNELLDTKLLLVSGYCMFDKTLDSTIPDPALFDLVFEGGQIIIAWVITDEAQDQP